MVPGSGQVAFPPSCAPSSMIVASQTMMSRSKLFGLSLTLFSPLFVAGTARLFALVQVCLLQIMFGYDRNLGKLGIPKTLRSSCRQPNVDMRTSVMYTLSQLSVSSSSVI